MIKELFKWVFEIIKDFFTLRWKYLAYDIQNLYWYLIYGFTYSDIQDMDKYLAHKLSVMLPKFIRNTVGYPDNMTPESYKKDLEELADLASFIYSNKFEDSKWKTQNIKKNRFKNLLSKYWFHLWF